MCCRERWADHDWAREPPIIDAQLGLDLVQTARSSNPKIACYLNIAARKTAPRLLSLVSLFKEEGIWTQVSIWESYLPNNFEWQTGSTKKGPRIAAENHVIAWLKSAKADIVDIRPLNSGIPLIAPNLHMSFPVPPGWIDRPKSWGHPERCQYPIPLSMLYPTYRDYHSQLDPNLRQH